MLFLLLGAAVRLDESAASILAKDSLTCLDWAVAANEYIALGESRAIARLKTEKPDVEGRFNTRHCLLCRILFVPKSTERLRPPALGALELPFHSMAHDEWPEEPFVQQDGVWFLLSESYSIGGYPEQIAGYAKYCQEAGTFRQRSVRLPTSEEAIRALDRLLQSKRWKAMDWREKELFQSGDPSMLDRIQGDLRAQTSF